MERSGTNTYALPVDQLLTYGELRIFSGDKWPDYLALGIGPEHIPDLIRMATDEELHWADEDSLEVWAPIHAWRTLGQLRAEAAIEPLFSLFIELDGNDWVTEELPEVFGMIGPAALPMLKVAISDTAAHELIRIYAIVSVEKIGIHWPEARSACIAFLMEQLALFAVNTPGVNGFLVTSLVELQVIEAAPLIEQAFAATCVDLVVIGDWEDVQVALGLKSAQEAALTVLQMPSKIKREAGHKSTKSKVTKQSRKKNRKQ